MMQKLVFALCFAVLLLQPAFADEALDTQIAEVQHQWAKAMYQTPKPEQQSAFKTVVEHAQALVDAHPNSAEALTWQGISYAGYAKAKGGLGALKYAEKARDLLLASEKINPNVLNGATLTSLGTLYYKVPGGLLGFGDKKKAKSYLERALKINPNGIDPNFFYGEYLFEQGDTEKAIEYYKKAEAAPARVGREDADAGRRKEIAEALKKAESQRK